MIKGAWVVGLSFLLLGCGGGGGGASNAPAYQASSPGQGNTSVTLVEDVAMGLVAPQFMVYQSNRVYVADRTISATNLAGTVRQIDVTNGVSTAIGSPRGPVGVAFAPAGAFFVTGTNPLGQTGLMQMTVPGGALTDRVQGRSPAGVVFEPGGYAYFVDGSGDVMVLDSGLQAIRNVSFTGNPVGLAYMNNNVYVTLYSAGANALYRFLKTGTQATLFASSTYFNQPTAIAARSSADELYVVNSGGSYEERSILKVSADGTVTPFLSAQNTSHKLCSPSGVAVDDANSVLYVANGACPGSLNAAHAGKVIKVALGP